MSFSDVSIRSIKLARRLWPFAKGRDFPNHLGAFAARLGLLEPVWFHETILLEGLWDPNLTSLINERLNPGDVFVDVGAHSGYFTLLAAKRVKPTGNVLSIEPNPKIFDQLVQNIAASEIVSPIVEQVACSDSAKDEILYIHDDTNSSMSSLSHLNIANTHKVSVTCTTLDSLVEKHQLTRVDLIKIDVEGAELSVLRGALRTLRKMNPMIVLELDTRLLSGFGVTMDDVTRLLDDFDYDVRPLGSHANYVCEPKIRHLTPRVF
jgi:FkbM family methyltransferase